MVIEKDSVKNMFVKKRFKQEKRVSSREILFVFDLKTRGGVLSSTNLESCLQQECSTGTFYLILSDGAHSHSSWILTVCNNAKGMATS